MLLLRSNRRPLLLRARATKSGPKAAMLTGQNVSALPEYSDVISFSYREGIIDLDAGVSNGIPIFVWPSKSCTARRLPVRR